MLNFRHFPGAAGAKIIAAALGIQGRFDRRGLSFTITSRTLFRRKFTKKAQTLTEGHQLFKLLIIDLTLLMLRIPGRPCGAHPARVQRRTPRSRCPGSRESFRCRRFRRFPAHAVRSLLDCRSGDRRSLVRTPHPHPRPPAPLPSPSPSSSPCPVSVSERGSKLPRKSSCHVCTTRSLRKGSAYQRSLGVTERSLGLPGRSLCVVRRMLNDERHKLSPTQRCS